GLSCAIGVVPPLVPGSLFLPAGPFWWHRVREVHSLWCVCEAVAGHEVGVLQGVGVELASDPGPRFAPGACPGVFGVAAFEAGPADGAWTVAAEASGCPDAGGGGEDCGGGDE